MDELMDLINVYVVNPYITHEIPSTKLHPNGYPWSESYSLTRQFIIMWVFLYLSSLVVYYLMATMTYLIYYTRENDEQKDPKLKLQREQDLKDKTLSKTALKHASVTNIAHWQFDQSQIFWEISTSTWSLGVMSGLTAAMETYIYMGHGFLYTGAFEFLPHKASVIGNSIPSVLSATSTNTTTSFPILNFGSSFPLIADYSGNSNSFNILALVYFILSPVFFLVFTDFLIYWIHRGLHHRYFYFLHKLHHKYKETTPYAAFAFHPLDGFAQSFPYHIFVLFFPMHAYLYLLTLLLVGCWTINIHDRVTFDWWGINGAAHHTIHHTKFNYNYGQYFTWCDRLFGTYKEPKQYWPYKEIKSN